MYYTCTTQSGSGLTMGEPGVKKFADPTWPNQSLSNYCQQWMCLHSVHHNPVNLVESYYWFYVHLACVHLGAVQWHMISCRYSCCSVNLPLLEGGNVLRLWRGSLPLVQGSWGPPAGRRHWYHHLWWRTSPHLQLAAGLRRLDSSSSPQCPPPPPAAWDRPAHCTESTGLSTITWHEF